MEQVGGLVTSRLGAVNTAGQSGRLEDDLGGVVWWRRRVSGGVGG